MDGLPDKISDLIEVALGDLERIEKDGRYVVNMGTWHAPDHNGKCHVCLAGAVVSRTVDPDKDWYPQNPHVDPTVKHKMLALDAAAQGSVGIAYHLLTGLTKCVVGNVTVVPYNVNPSAFKICLQYMVVLLREHGL